MQGPGGSFDLHAIQLDRLLRGTQASRDRDPASLDSQCGRQQRDDCRIGLSAFRWSTDPDLQPITERSDNGILSGSRHGLDPKENGLLAGLEVGGHGTRLAVEAEDRAWRCYTLPRASTTRT